MGSADGRLYCVSVRDGKKLWEYDIGAAVSGSIAVTGNWLYVPARDGTLYAFHAVPR